MNHERQDDEIKRRNELADTVLKELQAVEKGKQINEWEDRRLANQNKQTTIDKLRILNTLLQACNVDESKTILPGDILWKNAFDESELRTIKDKIFKLIYEL